MKQQMGMAAYWVGLGFGMTKHDAYLNWVKKN